MVAQQTLALLVAVRVRILRLIFNQMEIKGKIYYSVFIFKINGKINALDIVSSYEFFIDKIINQL